MAKVQVVIAATFDGFLPEDDENLLQWVRNDKKGFPVGRKSALIFYSLVIRF